jgi:hypothetical protein
VTNATNPPYGSFFVVALSRRLWFLVGVDRSRGESRIVTAEAVSSAPVGEAGFRLPADQLPDLIVLAFDPQLVMWAATGGGLRGNGWTPREPRRPGQRRAGHLGAMRERVEALGGRFRVTTAPSQGTVIEARLPLTDPTERWGA